jgi:endonuclease/exonuclease/phosphatase (EEP) superfamily protein YafD
MSQSARQLPFAGCLLLALTTSVVAQAAENGPDCAAALGQPQQAEQALATSFSVLSWNIQKSSNTGWERDLGSLAMQADLVFIQEAALQASIPEMLVGTPATAFAPGYRTASLDTGVLTLSSVAPSAHCRFTAIEPWLGTPKASSITEHPLAGRSDRLLAVNLHAVNFALGLADFEEQFAAVGEVLEAHEGPAIIAGDLNTWSQSRQRSVDQFMADFGLRPVQFDPDLRTTTFGLALDHIYVRGLAATAATVIPVDSSDHNALQVQLALD